MKILKSLIIFLAGVLSTATYFYMYQPEPLTVVEQEACPDIRIRDMVSCPEHEFIECNPPKVVEVVVYKEKIVYRDKKLGPGCHVNWKTREVKAETVKGYSLDCVVDWKNRKVDEVIFKSDMLRSRNRRPLP